MAHKIAAKKAAFIGTADEIWHTAYTNLIGREDGKALRGVDLIQLAGADYDVYKVPMFIKSKSGAMVEVPYGTSIVRDPWGTYEEEGVTIDEGDDVPVQLGLVRGGPRAKYVIRQNIETAQFFDELVDAGLMTYTGAAVLEHGVAFFIAAQIAEGVVRTNPDGSDDVIKGFGTLYNRHDGCSSSVANWSGTRVVCDNTMRAALATGINARIAHSGKMAMKFEEAKAEIAKGSEQFAALLSQLRTMNAKRATKTTVEKLFELTFPTTKEGAKEEKAFSSRRLKQIAAITDLMMTGLGNGAGTVYDWYNGVTQYLDHDDDGRGASTADVFVSSNFGSRANIRERAFQAAMKVAA